jgi:hypothetical protein
VQKINAVKLFAQGGKASVTGGKPHALGGTKYYGEDGNVVELEQGENWYVLKKTASQEINSLSRLNQKHGGVSWTEPRPFRTYALGGSVQPGITQNLNVSDIERIIVRTVSNMPPIYVVAQDVSEVNAISNQTSARARVL